MEIGNPKGSDESDRERIRALFADLPELYGEQFQVLLRLRNLFHEEMGSCLQKGLNAFIAKQHPDTPSAKDAIAAHVTHDLRMLGLAVKSPSTSDPARLSVVEVDEQGTPTVKFRLESLKKGPRRADPTFDQVPRLKIMNDPPRIETLPLILPRSRPGGGRGR